MQRRGFLGSVIGTVIGFQGEFRAEEIVTRESTKFKRLQAYYDLFKTCNPKCLKIFLTADTGEKFYAPHIVEAKFDKENLIAILTSAPINITQTLTICNTGAIYVPYSFVLSNVPNSINAKSGDVISVTYKLSVD